MVQIELDGTVYHLLEQAGKHTQMAHDATQNGVGDKNKKHVLTYLACVQGLLNAVRVNLMESGEVTPEDFPL